MNTRTIRVASLQLKAHDRPAFDFVWPHICEQVVRAAAGGAELIVLPEGTVPAYVIGNAPLDSSITERALTNMQEIAQKNRVVIVYGTARFEGKAMFNSALVVNSDGALAGYADKCFLWHFDRQWFVAGQVRAPIETAIGTLGVMICADGRIPTIARSLTDNGAQMLVMPTAWVSSGRDSADLENVQADLLARIRARENGVPFLAANKAGVEQGCVLYCGKSQIVASDGELVALASQHDAETLTATITVRATTPQRSARANPPHAMSHGRPARLSIGPHHAPPDAALQGVLETEMFIGADPQTDGLAHSALGALTSDDATFLDPAGLVPYKLAGYQLVIWRPRQEHRSWAARLARARALELRVYVVCIIEGETAFAVDPDGVVVCGTFGDFRIASFPFSPERTRQTFVAPNTDIIEGLERVRF